MVKNWKSVEIRLTKWLDGKVKAVRQSKMYLGTNVEDISYGDFSIEVKSRGIFPKYINEWFSQATTNSKGKIPIVVWHEDGVHVGEEYVVIRLKDFKEYVERNTNVVK